MDTIVAQSTPPIASAIAVIRLSGNQALRLCSGAFSPFKSGKAQPRRAYFGRLDVGSVCDDCVCVYFQAPASYTGEDVVEIYCHGSVAITTAVIEYFIKSGARLAQPGEFTRRAFENGKLDLTESEAVIDLINARSEAEAKSAYNQLGGALSKVISSLQDAVTATIAKTEAAIDYPEEDVEEFTSRQLRSDLLLLRERLISLKSTYHSGKIMRDGVRVAIVGKPNAGKSRLMNALLGYERSIVTEIEGTTRDYVEESFCYKDLRFRLTDTAGIRKTDDVVESQGVQRSIDIAKSADIVLHILQSKGEAEQDFGCRQVITIENKIDLNKPTLGADVNVSALTGEGLEELRQRLYGAAKSLTGTGEGYINNARHLEAVTAAEDCLTRALDGIDEGMPLDLISDDVMGVYRALGSITGITGSDKIVGEIFSRFCVGK